MLHINITELDNAIDGDKTSIGCPQRWRKVNKELAFALSMSQRAFQLVLFVLWDDVEPIIIRLAEFSFSFARVTFVNFAFCLIG